MIKPITGRLYTDANAANADATDDNDNNTQWTEHDCIGSLPNEPKKLKVQCSPILEMANICTKQA